MKILYDLVTVIEERYTFAKALAWSKVTEKSGRLYIVLILKSGNLPFCWYRIERFRSRGIDRTVFRLPSGGLFAIPSACAEVFLLHLRFIPFIERTLKIIKKCGKVICCAERFGTMNKCCNALHPTKVFRKAADYYSVINAVKHPFDSGVNARKGIEF